MADPCTTDFSTDHRLTIRHVIEDRVATIDLEGELDLANAGRVVSELTALLRRPSVLWILDLAKVSFIDSAGARALLESVSAAQRDRQVVVAPSMAPIVKRVLVISDTVDCLMNGR